MKQLWENTSENLFYYLNYQNLFYQTYIDRNYNLIRYNSQELFIKKKKEVIIHTDNYDTIHSTIIFFFGQRLIILLL